MKETTFRTVGKLPATEAIWHIREGGGHMYFVSEDPKIGAYGLVDGVFVRAVDAAEEPAAPLIMPKVMA